MNTARGGIIDEERSPKVLADGHLAGAALDVFATEPTTESPLFALPNVVVTPHLGASTREAQDKAGVTVAEMVQLALKGEFVPYAGQRLGRGRGRPRWSVPSSRSPSIWAPSCRGSRAAVGGGRRVLPRHGIAEHDTRVLTLAILKGILGRSVNEPVSFVNAPMLARDRGLTVSEMRSTVSQDYVSLITIRAETDDGPGQRAWARSSPRTRCGWLLDRRVRRRGRAGARMVFFNTSTVRASSGGRHDVRRGRINIATMDVGRRAEGGTRR